MRWTDRIDLDSRDYAEIRIRRGRLAGVDRILRKGAQDSAVSGNLRKLAMDLSLEARWCLARGLLTKAEVLLRQCLDALDDIDWLEARSETHLLLGRVLAWLGRPKAAHRSLVRASEDLLQAEPHASPNGIDLARLPKGVLEPEEIPALLLQVGEFQLAALASGGLGSEPLWRNLARACAGRGVKVSSQDVAEAVRELEPYRAARVVFDALLCGARLDKEVLTMASEQMARAGAPWLARGIDGASGDGWAAVTGFLDALRDAEAAGGEDVREQALRSLFAGVGLPGIRVELTTAQGSEVLLVGPGGNELVTKPVNGGELHFHCPAVSERLEAVFSVVASVLDGGAGRPWLTTPSRAGGSPSANVLPTGVVGQSEALIAAYSSLRRLARVDMPLLIVGETGTGKERAARAVHEESSRRDGPFLPINCAALDEHLGLSDLFGHVKGAFTGADKDRRGVFESAARGTVFLDEIGDLSLGGQGLLLRVLQESEVRRLGESEASSVDVRIVAATHRSLEQQVGAGTFREDLLYRLNTGVVSMPPLRARGQDALLLAEHFRLEFGALAGFTEQAKNALTHFAWPGNVRQLRSSVQRACALADDAPIQASHLGLQESAPLAGWHEWLEEVKRERLSEELARHDGNQSATARSLGLTRQALSYLVRKLRLL